MTEDTPLGRVTDYPIEYAPDCLFSIPRSEARALLGVGTDLPFHGTDIWNAWELTWLARDGKPIVATAVIFVAADSINIVESKSLKLYLNSFAMTRYDSVELVRELITKDLTDSASGEVTVNISTLADSKAHEFRDFPGQCIDGANASSWQDKVNPDVLACDKRTLVAEELFSHVLRSNCPVTNQPDYGSVLIRYAGPQIDRESLLQYIVSFRQHNDFHEACVERMFLDLRRHCATTKLTVYARYNRRGGLDINPFRTDTTDAPENLRLWRQ